MEIYTNNNNVYVKVDKNSLNFADTLDCGQCFRFAVNGDGSVTGVAFGKQLTVSQTDSELVFHDTMEADFRNTWLPFFALDIDYDAIKKSLDFDETLRLAMDFAGGIRIIRQSHFEALCSFIISQNNNIPRIKGSISRLCERFGDKLCDTDSVYTFPTPKRLNGITTADLAGLGLGYRDAYIVDCVEKIASCELDLEDICTMDIALARETLRKIKGVGPKVAECALLFGFHRLEAFPIDTWIKKVLEKFYPNGFPAMNEYAGVAQQYLFHYIRAAL